MRTYSRPAGIRATGSTIIDALAARDLLELVDDVCRLRGVARADLCGRIRSRSVSRARQETWWRLRLHPHRFYSLVEIARLFGRDHATVRAGVLAHARRLAADGASLGTAP